MNVAEHIAAVRDEGKRFAAAARSASLEVPIPSCPGWTMRDLVRHLSEIHLWAAAHVGLRATKLWVDDLTELSGYWPDLGVFWPDDSDLIDHYVRTNENLLRELEAAPDDVKAMTFLPALSPRAMWARRQAHEIAVHRFDAAHAAGETSGFTPGFASDGIDEILTAFAPRASALPVERRMSMGVHATDTGHVWTVSMGPDGISTTRTGGDADVTLTGSASDLYLTVWNRGDRSSIRVEGDAEVLDAWRYHHRVRWS